MKIARGVTTAGVVTTAAATTDGRWCELLGDLREGYTLTQREVSFTQWLAPVEPPFIWAAGINYRKHAAEMGRPEPEYPVFFAKGINALSAHEAPIHIPRHACVSTKVDWECELAIVIGRTVKNLTMANAMDCVFGYTCANDVSARDWQIEHGGSQWVRGKSFDGFCPLGPWLVTADELGDPHQLGIRTRVNGRTMQESRTSDLIFDLPTLLTFISADTTLYAGTVILTGTPSGVGMGHTPPAYLQPGDTVEVEIERIGILRNYVAGKAASA